MDDLEKLKENKLKDAMKRIKKEEKTTEWPKRPMEVNDSNFNEVVQRYPLAVVDCWADWCAPCRMIAPVLESLANDYFGKIVFGKLNVDANPRITGQYNIMSIPTLLIFKNGKIVDQAIGAMPRQMLEEKIIKHL